jgi:hypothetical protein
LILSDIGTPARYRYAPTRDKVLIARHRSTDPNPQAFRVDQVHQFVDVVGVQSHAEHKTIEQKKTPICQSSADFWLPHQPGCDVANGSPHRVRTLVLAFALVIAIAMICVRLMAADDSPLSKEQIKEFLLNAQVVSSKESTKGVTHPVVLTLSDGTLTHDASFQNIDEHKQLVNLASGKSESNFVDSYKYNIAVYSGRAD